VGLVDIKGYVSIVGQSENIEDVKAPDYGYLPRTAPGLKKKYRAVRTLRETQKILRSRPLPRHSLQLQHLLQRNRRSGGQRKETPYSPTESRMLKIEGGGPRTRVGGGGGGGGGGKLKTCEAIRNQ